MGDNKPDKERVILRHFASYIDFFSPFPVSVFGAIQAVAEFHPSVGHAGRAVVLQPLKIGQV